MVNLQKYAMICGNFGVSTQINDFEIVTLDFKSLRVHRLATRIHGSAQGTRSGVCRGSQVRSRPGAGSPVVLEGSCGLINR